MLTGLLCPEFVINGDKQLMIDRQISIATPEMTIAKYAESVGVSERTVRGWIDKGFLPTTKIGKRRMVNVGARILYCLQQAQGDVA